MNVLVQPLEGSYKFGLTCEINNGSWTEWRAIWSEIIRVISKSNERAAVSSSALCTLYFSISPISARIQTFHLTVHQVDGLQLRNNKIKIIRISMRINYSFLKQNLQNFTSELLSWSFYALCGLLGRFKTHLAVLLRTVSPIPSRSLSTWPRKRLYSHCFESLLLVRLAEHISKLSRRPGTNCTGVHTRRSY